MIPHLRAGHEAETKILRERAQGLQTDHDQLLEQLRRFQAEVVVMQEETTAVVRERGQAVDKWKADAQRAATALAAEKANGAQSVAKLQQLRDLRATEAEDTRFSNVFALLLSPQSVPTMKISRGTFLCGNPQMMLQA